MLSTGGPVDHVSGPPGRVVVNPPITARQVPAISREDGRHLVPKKGPIQMISGA